MGRCPEVEADGGKAHIATSEGAPAPENRKSSWLLELARLYC